MKSARPAVFLSAAALMLGGCNSIFTASRPVTVDAIAVTGPALPAGQSYKLVARRGMLASTEVNLAVIVACVNAALTGKGLYEAPASVAPDMFVDVSYGAVPSPSGDPDDREVFLHLVAAANPARVLDPVTETDELWDVRVGVTGIEAKIETAMPLLASTLTGYIGADTHAAVTLKLPLETPAVAAVRERALKALKPPAPPAAK